METIINRKYKMTTLAVILFSFLIFSSCSITDPENDLNAVSNALPAAQPNKREPGGLPGLEINKVSGHKWVLIYDAAKEIGSLKVSIVSWDIERNSMTDIHFNCEYTFEEISKISGGIELSLEESVDPTGSKISDGIRGAINHCYGQSGFSGSAASVEWYPAVQFEVIGEWQKQGAAGTMVQHDSFSYGFQSSGSGDQILVLNLDGYPGNIGNRAISDESEAFPLVNQEFRAASNYEFWKSLSEPQGELKFVEHFVWESNGDVTHFSPKTEVSANSALIKLDGTAKLSITIPAELKLEQFIIDPKSFGSGG